MNLLNFLRRSFLAGLFFSVSAGLTGAADLTVGNTNQENIFCGAPVLPPNVRRIVVLPLAHEETPVELAAGSEMLFPVLQSELIKTKKFEVVAGSAKTVQDLTGRSDWTGAEVLPPNFFSSLQQAYGCDAVLFCELTTFHAYAPLLVGWRMKLVDVSTQKILWAADVAFDATDAAVRRNAQDFQKQQQNIHDKPRTFFNKAWAWLNREPEPVTDDQWTVLNSPRYFGQFSVYQLLQTLPAR
jgi:hypothetical protein